MFCKIVEQMFYKVAGLGHRTKHSKETKIILLQWKILHKIYPCNKYLHQIKLSESELCIDCNNADTLEHFFLGMYHHKKIME